MNKEKNALQIKMRIADEAIFTIYTLLLYMNTEKK